MPKQNRKRRRLEVIEPESDPRGPDYGDAITAVKRGGGNTPVIPIKMETDPETGKRRVGRPSKYREHFCDILIQHMAQGNPFESAAALFHVPIRTLWQWSRDHSEFSRAREIGRAYQLAWWVELGKAITADDPTHQLQMIGVQPFLKKQTTRHYHQSGHTEVTDEYHVPRGNTGMYTFMMSNMFRDDGWSNPMRHEHTGKGGGPIKTENDHNVRAVHLVGEMPTEQLSALTEVQRRIASGELAPADQKDQEE